MIRRCIAFALVAAVAVLALAVAPAGAAPAGGGCQLAGNAAFSPGLTTTAKKFGYSFSGKLTSCQSTVAGAPASGTVGAGQVFTAKGQRFQEPKPSGNGSCQNGTTSGIAIITWAGGKYTVIKYTTNSAAAVVLLQGTVIPSVTLPAIAPKTGQLTKYTVKTTLYGGANAQGPLTFQPPDPTACNSTGGVKSAAISGAATLGSTG